ncbi:MAG TPA: tetratricopeptide repeat protein, partial [Thermoanaerobaculia bacterium]|nr:tetratricopeptide repeat protein [Thermoanaerobaculia bacterium]
MRILRILTLCFFVVTGARAAEPVAIVYSLTGEASLLAPDHRPLRLFERLPAGAIVEAGAATRVELAFGNGRRYELGGSSRVKLGPKGLASRTGPVRSLPKVPPLPRLAPIAAKDRPGPRAGAVRIRTEIITGLHPDRGFTSLPSAIRLRFDPVPAAPGYRIRILDQTGETRFQIDTQETKVEVPPGALKPGESYLWTVETRDRPGGVARGEATLTLLDQGRARAREKLRIWVERSGSAEDHALLTAVDQALGLSESCRPGLVIETVAPESAASLAGLKPGDQLFSWCLETTCHELRTPFAWLDVQMDELQRGGVVVEGTRGSESLRWPLLPTLQGITVAPNRCADAALWLLADAAQLRAKARQWSEADAAYEAALAQARAMGEVRAEPHLLMAWSETLLLHGDLAGARQQLERALALEEKHRPEGMGVATVLNRLGNVIEKQDDLAEADRLYRRAYGLIVPAAPGSGTEAAVTNNLAVTAGRRGDLAQSEIHAARALAIREKLTPASPAIIPALLNYGILIYVRGDYAGAEAAFLRARGILEKNKPESVELATVLHNLGVLANERGDHESAEDLFQREHAIFEKIDPSGNLLRDSLGGLGEVALRQGHGAEAERWWRGAQAIAEKLNPKGRKNI